MLYTREATTCPIRLAGDFHLDARRCEDCTAQRLSRLTLGEVEERYHTGRIGQDAFEGYALAWALLSPTGDPDRVTIPDLPDVCRFARKVIKARGLPVPVVIV
ncbi:hypothetical protein AB0J27_20420 [Micromonospora chokoriensis]